MPKLDLTTLESWLQDSASILQSSIDSSDSKNFTFGLLFLKRSNDVFEEEVESIMSREGISRTDAEQETYLRVPAEARQNHLKIMTENIGMALDKAFAAIKRENLMLEGVMTATKYVDKEKLSDDVLQMNYPLSFLAAQTGPARECCELFIYHQYSIMLRRS